MPADPLDALNRLNTVKRKIVSGAIDPPTLTLLKTWQSQRIGRTYADLMAIDRYRAAGDFFLTELYGARDFSQRDQDILEMYNFARNYLPPPVVATVEKTVRLYFLTQDLDQKLHDTLITQLGMTTELTPAMYADGYRACNNYADRKLQIELLDEIGELIDSVVRVPLIGSALAMTKLPAKRAGWGELMDFLERGFNAFKQMKGAKLFLGTVKRREMRILDLIFAGSNDPFASEEKMRTMTGTRKDDT